MDGLKITVEYIWADSYYEKALISIEHLDKRPFTEEGSSEFHHVNFKNKAKSEKSAVKAEGIATNRLEPCGYKSAASYKKYFIMSAGNGERREKGKAVLDLGEYEEKEEVETLITPEVMTYLNAHSQTEIKDRELSKGEQQQLEILDKEVKEAESFHFKVCYEQVRQSYLEYLKTGLKAY